MLNRRKFIGATLAAGISSLLPNVTMAFSLKGNNAKKPLPVIISTWNHGLAANEAAMNVLKNGGSVVDAVEQGVWVPEADPDNMSVGLGGLPDRDGYVTLDSCIMAPDGNAGSVAFLQNIVHPVSVARKVMEDTPHEMLVGEGALKFALEKGFEKENLLTPKAQKRWEEWLEYSDYKPEQNWENNHNEIHDTIGLLAIDKNSNIAGACTTSGLAFKVHGRVGDSPIIGAGLYVDNEIGGATATGVGELVMKTLGSFLIVEFMRNGMSPQKACEEAVKRIVLKIPDSAKFQVGYLAVNKNGETGAYSLQKGFTYALNQNGVNKIYKSNSYY
jgi:isoaspartyl peptidase/L-asparaginase-like protein (Ntn-hydrolase superfamily)